MRENYLDQTKEQQKLNELIKLVHKEQQQHQEKVKMEEERRKLEEEQLKQIKEKKEEEKIEKEKAKIEKEKGSRHGNPYLKLNTNDYNGDTSFSIIDNQIQATKAAKNKNNFQRKLRLLKSKKHAGFNQELNSDLLKDEPGLCIVNSFHPTNFPFIYPHIHPYIHSLTFFIKQHIFHILSSIYPPIIPSYYLSMLA